MHRVNVTTNNRMHLLTVHIWIQHYSVWSPIIRDRGFELTVVSSGSACEISACLYLLLSRAPINRSSTTVIGVLLKLNSVFVHPKLSKQCWPCLSIVVCKVDHTCYYGSVFMAASCPLVSKGFTNPPDHKDVFLKNIRFVWSGAVSMFSRTLMDVEIICCAGFTLVNQPGKQSPLLYFLECSF